MMTLSKVAKLANVSVSTASKAFTGSPEVNAQTREMIFAIAKKHGCFKKFYNAKYPKLVVAVIAPEFDSAQYTRYLSFIQDSFGEENCELCVSVTNFSDRREKELLEYYYKHSNVDGIIVIEAQTDIAADYEIPVVQVNPRSASVRGLSVSGDVREAFGQSIDHLAERGVDTIGFVGETLTDGKCALFRRVLEEKGLTYNEAFVSVTDERFATGGYVAMERLFVAGRLPRAVVCAYDYMAIGAIRCIYDHGLCVPQDVAVLGFDDIPEAAFLNPPLASISCSTQTLCHLAVEMLLRSINGEPTQPHQVVASSFCCRRSWEIE